MLAELKKVAPKKLANLTEAKELDAFLDHIQETYSDEAHRLADIAKEQANIARLAKINTSDYMLALLPILTSVRDKLLAQLIHSIRKDFANG